MKQAPPKKAEPVIDLQESTVKKEEPPIIRSGMGVSGKIGTLGYGGELYARISDSIVARAGLNAYSYKYNANSSQLNYDFSVKLQTISAVADWYPFAGDFRTSAGLLYNNNKYSLAANPTGGNFIIGAGTYSSTTQVASLNATMAFNKIAPYFGLGWGNPVAKDKGWGLVTDIGLLFQGNPIIDLTVTCVSICAGTLQADAAAENAKLQNDFSGLKWWPVASIGISYQW